MRIVWKDSATPRYKPLKYKGYLVTGDERGWMIDYPGDNNIYKAIEDAKTAINAHLGVKIKSKDPRCHTIRIIGKKNATA